MSEWGHCIQIRPGTTEPEILALLEADWQNAVKRCPELAAYTPILTIPGATEWERSWYVNTDE